MTLWTQDDIQKLNEMILMKKSFAKIAKVLGKSPLAVKYKFGRLYRKKMKEMKENKEMTESTEDDENNSESNSDVDSEIKPDSYSKSNIHHKRSLSEESDPSIYVKYSPPITTCALLTIVVSGGLSIFVCGVAVFASTLLDSLNRIHPS